MKISQGCTIKRYYNDEYYSTYIVLETEIIEDHHNMALYPIHYANGEIEKPEYGLPVIDWHKLRPHDDEYPINFRVRDHNMRWVPVTGVKP